MATPVTPSKGDISIEKVKQIIATRWGLRFPHRDQLVSPDSRDRDAIEEKVHRHIQFLYYQKQGAEESAALHHALTRFDQEAPTIISIWRFKPRSESGVIPLGLETKLGRDFLHRRAELGEDASREMMLRLETILREVKEDVQGGRPFQSQEPIKTQPTAKKSSSENSHAKKAFSRSSTRRLSRQTSISNYYGPDSRTTRIGTSQQLSSDDFAADEDTNDILDTHPMPEFKYEPQSKQRSQLTKPSDSSTESDSFVTPPTSPSYEQQRGIPRLVRTPPTKNAELLVFHKPPLPSPNSRKRRTDTSEAKRPRKASRESSRHRSVSEPRDLRVPEASCVPVDMAKMSATITSLTEEPDLFYVSSASSRSETRPSVTSSMTSRSAWSPNTSFGADSRTTSFDSFSDRKDSEISGPPPSERRILRSESSHRSKLSLRDQSVLCSNDVDNVRDENAGISVVKQPSGLILDFHLRLESSWPFESNRLVEKAKVPFRQIYEVCRFAIASKKNISAFASCLTTREDDYHSLWSSLTRIGEVCGRALPERSSATAWERAVNEFRGVSLNARMTFRDSRQGPIFDLQLMPLRIEPSYRFSRKFCNDRFCVITMPRLGSDSLPSHLKAHEAAFRGAFVRWLITSEHKMLGRTWRAFCVKPESTKKKKKQKKPREAKDVKFRVYLFAEDGLDFWVVKPSGEADDRILSRPRTSVREMIEWFMPFEQNTDQRSLKLFARLGLGLTSTVATVTFKPGQIVRTNDARANSPRLRKLDTDRKDKKDADQLDPSQLESAVMNDGCARISRLAAKLIANKLDLDSVPSVFQGRIGGAKGIWMVDAINEVIDDKEAGAVWIEITDSQLKFQAHPVDLWDPDPDRVTFEVSNWSKRLIPSHLNYQLIPILQDRGVPAEVFKHLVGQDLRSKEADFELAMDNSLALKKWNQVNNSTSSERMKCGGIEMCGGLPDSTSERINWLVDHGFEPKHCDYLRSLLFDLLKDYCMRVEEQMKIGLALSTNAYIMSDPLDVLAEGEIHVGFSGSFKDKDGFDHNMLHDIEVLVARLPAHLPSDVQKVRAVFKPELGMYQNVVVFSSRGKDPLASKLSGGDYDGDKAWICWEPTIVEPFQNAPVPEHPPPSSYGIEKDDNTIAELLTHPDCMQRFLTHAFEFNLQPSMLGSCTIYHEAYCYAQGNINSTKAISIGSLLGSLVDAPKAGFRYDKAKWNDYLKREGLPLWLETPAYKNKEVNPKRNLIDDLVFNVAKGAREDTLSKFHNHFNDTTTWDEDLVRLYKREKEEMTSDPSLNKILKDFLIAFDKIVDYWNINARPENDTDIGSRGTKSKEIHGPSYRAVAEKCREDFLKISPCIDETTWHQASSLVQRWAKEHQEGRTGEWDLVKASTAFYKHHQRRCIWYIAGPELGELKAMANGRGTYRTVVHGVFETFKFDSKLADRFMSLKKGDDVDSQSVADEADDEDMDDFGEWGWEEAFDG